MPGRASALGNWASSRPFVHRVGAIVVGSRSSNAAFRSGHSRIRATAEAADNSGQSFDACFAGMTNSTSSSPRMTFSRTTDSKLRPARRSASLAYG